VTHTISVGAQPGDCWDSGEMDHEHLASCSGELLAQACSTERAVRVPVGTRLIDLKTRYSSGRGVKTYARRHRSKGRRSCGEPHEKTCIEYRVLGTVQYSTVGSTVQ
jgi:hypothetical protein